MYALISDVADLLGQEPPDLDGAQWRQWDKWLAATVTIIKTRVPNLDDLVMGGSLDRDTVVWVQSSVVARMVVTSDGVSKTEHTVKIGDATASESATYASWIIPGKLYLTDEEWDLLLPKKPTALTQLTFNWE